MTTADLLWLVTTLSAAYMTGVIWFVQVVHYSLMSAVAATGDEGWRRYHAAHCARTGWVVGGAMCAELSSGLALCWVLRSSGEIWVWAQAALVVGLWAVTGAVQARQHTALAQRFDAAVHERLLKGNWVRVALWSVRVAVLIWGGIVLGVGAGRG